MDTGVCFIGTDILRVKCPSCGKTHAVLPRLLLPYINTLFEFIFECLYLSYVMKSSYSRIVHLFKNSNPVLSFSPSNISSFKYHIKENVAFAN